MTTHLQELAERAAREMHSAMPMQMAHPESAVGRGIVSIILRALSEAVDLYEKERDRKAGDDLVDKLDAARDRVAELEAELDELRSRDATPAEEN